MPRPSPNIVITGTPGVGKTSHATLLAEKTSLKQLSINHIVKEHSCHDGWDSERKCWIVDEDKVPSPTSHSNNSSRADYDANGGSSSTPSKIPSTRAAI